MRKLVLVALFFFVYYLLSAQVIGNGKMKTISRNFDSIQKVFININGTVDIICGSDESKVEITYDENIVDLVNTSMKGGFLVLDQKKWIEGSRSVEITIYTDELRQLRNDSWSVVNVLGLNQKTFYVNSSISEINLAGKVEQLEVFSESSIINAKQLTAQDASIKISEDGQAHVHVIHSLDVNAHQDAYVSYKSKPEVIKGMDDQTYVAKRSSKKTRFINVSFKNNSLNKISAYVKGPKPGGGNFSYGLNFFPLATKKERWSIGTKLYKIGKFGNKTLLHEVIADDENQVVRLNKLN